MKTNTYLYLRGWGEIEEIGSRDPNTGLIHVYLVGGGDTWCRFSEIERRDDND
jgi:hypothetical protein